MIIQESTSINRAIQQLHRIIKVYGDMTKQGYLLLNTSYENSQEIDNISWLVYSNI